MTETWRDVPGYAGRYQVSDAGRVRSVRRVLAAPLSRGHPRVWLYPFTAKFPQVAEG